MEASPTTRRDYNATLYTTDDDGRIRSVCVGHVDEDGYILRSNAVQFTGKEDTREYHAYFMLSRTGPVWYAPTTDGYAAHLKRALRHESSALPSNARRTAEVER